MKYIFLIFLFFVVNLSHAQNSEANVLDFCTKYSTCRNKARIQLLNCSDGLSQLVLSKHASNASFIGEDERLKNCTNELASNIKKTLQRDYDYIEEKTFKCTKEVDPNSYKLDKAQELLCQAVYNETNLDGNEVQGTESSSECYQNYEADLDECELIRNCCPQFETCQEKTEKESGIVAKEKAIAIQLQTCFKKSGVEISLSSDSEPEKTNKKANDDVDVRFSPTRRPYMHRFDPKLPRATPVPRTHVVSDEAINQKIAQIKRRKLEKDGKLHEEQTPRRKHKRPQKKDDAEENLPAPHIEVIAQEISQTTPPAVKEEKPVKKAFQRDESQPKVPQTAKHFLNEVLCRQYAECEEILEKENRECESLFGVRVENDNGVGIEDQEMRIVFLNNSKTEDAQIKRKCLENVDAETQRHLTNLKNAISRQNEECTFKQIQSHLNLNGCQKIGLLTELAELKHSSKDLSITNVEECKQRLDGFRQKCTALQSCCPQRVTCELTNESVEVQKYKDIETQLKLEQNLCEARHQRIHDGFN